jgi:hypothetical protein
MGGLLQGRQRRQSRENYKKERKEEAEMRGLPKGKAKGGRDERITKGKG